MGTYSVWITVTVNGVEQAPHQWGPMSAKETANHGLHFIDRSLRQIMGFLPDPDKAAAGTNTVVIVWEVKRDSDGALVGQQTNVWPTIGDAEVQAITGIFDGAKDSADATKGGKYRRGHGKV